VRLVFAAGATAALGQIASDGNNSAIKLRNETELFTGWEFCSQAINITNQSSGVLPDLELFIGKYT
jgi:hypothetical protein